MAVQNRLLSPSSASFGWVSYTDVTTSLGDGRYAVSSFVDAENAFGAKLRKSFSCEVSTADSGRTWSVTTVEIAP
jgi:hypothetical protein